MDGAKELGIARAFHDVSYLVIMVGGLEVWNNFFLFPRKIGNNRKSSSQLTKNSYFSEG